MVANKRAGFDFIDFWTTVDLIGKQKNDFNNKILVAFFWSSLWLSIPAVLAF